MCDYYDSVEAGSSGQACCTNIWESVPTFPTRDNWYQMFPTPNFAGPAFAQRIPSPPPPPPPISPQYGMWMSPSLIEQKAVGGNEARVA